MPLSDSDAKGRLSAYQRWEMTSFDEVKPAPASVSAELAAANRVALESLKLKAHKDGFNKGYEEGHQAGHSAGLNDMQQQLSNFVNVATNFNAAIKQAEHVVAEEVLDLALDLAKAMLKSALLLNPALIIPIVQEAIASLPSVQQPAQIFLHPRDATLVSHQIGEQLVEAGWTVVADPHLRSGDCRIETLKNQIHANMGTRWQVLTDALGRDDEWYPSETRGQRV